MPWCWNWQNPYTTGKQARLKVKMAELADAYGSEPYGATLEGSTPSLDTGAVIICRDGGMVDATAIMHYALLEATQM